MEDPPDRNTEAVGCATPARPLLSRRNGDIAHAALVAFGLQFPATPDESAGPPIRDMNSSLQSTVTGGHESETTSEHDRPHSIFAEAWTAIEPATPATHDEVVIYWYRWPTSNEHRSVTDPDGHSKEPIDRHHQ
jgi:hypothetical protein